jgi:hypothetical protein
LKEKQKKPRVGVLIGILFGVLCVGYGYFYLASDMFDTDDAAECHAIVTLVESVSSIPDSVSVPGHPGCFCGKGVRGFFLRPVDHVQSYGVIDEGHQDLVIASLKRARQQLTTRPIVAEFYQKENWRTWSDPATGRSGGTRGPETPIRRIVIK